MPVWQLDSGTIFIHTRRHPGDRGFKRRGKPFKRFRELALIQVTWLKPGVNESEPISSGTLQLVEHLFVDITPTPFFAGLEGLNDRMICGAKMFGRVFVL
jgi:hypothetical protein